MTKAVTRPGQVVNDLKPEIIESYSGMYTYFLLFLVLLYVLWDVHTVYIFI